LSIECRIISQSQWLLSTQQADLRIQPIRSNSVLSIHYYSDLAIDKCISIYTYSVLIEGHLVLCNPLSKNHSFD